jgi:hypothetical protein
MREGRLGYNSYNKRYGLLSSDLQDFTVENAWKCCLMMNGFRLEWK